MNEQVHVCYNNKIYSEKGKKPNEDSTLLQVSNTQHLSTQYRV